jgi:hypothetical protein
VATCGAGAMTLGALVGRPHRWADCRPCCPADRRRARAAGARSGRIRGLLAAAHQLLEVLRDVLVQRELVKVAGAVLRGVQGRGRQRLGTLPGQGARCWRAAPRGAHLVDPQHRGEGLTRQLGPCALLALLGGGPGAAAAGGLGAIGRGRDRGAGPAGGRWRARARARCGGSARPEARRGRGAMGPGSRRCRIDRACARAGIERVAMGCSSCVALCSGGAAASAQPAQRVLGWSRPVARCAPAVALPFPLRGRQGPQGRAAHAHARSRAPYYRRHRGAGTAAALHGRTRGSSCARIVQTCRSRIGPDARRPIARRGRHAQDTDAKPQAQPHRRAGGPRRNDPASPVS